MSGPIGELENIYTHSVTPKAHTSVQDKGETELYWYFAYGSNLNNETFLVRRGIRPFRQLRLLVPGWRLNFQIAGIPYAEPGFGSIDRFSSADSELEKSQPVLHGMAYLISSKDYWHIIATEGGDSSYRQIQVQAIDPLTKEEHKVWTLQAVRPRKDCQPSLRYITIIRQGAREHNFPQEYLEYLDSVEPFILKGKRQKIGAALFIGFFMPIITWIFALRALLTKENGEGPAWLSAFARIVFKTAWSIHDKVWADKFGRGDHNA
ncbi:protein of unknown function [Taphrina deformans PYCC 5710]|uniref:gamma-glutamylcyclotransferase n=1 Tax=Taphrina deformans (strain PYCC 5710 / ATCC 11124 / CBS 356.35 / IMI 108563 / JCM 9778 / NBRC 8474) TaxID=1097556 RepID=R4XFZ2_TAPDE|nr:protein of unknown function [Taphrina deformans PYCC 5710]|eukprot:CCG84585.1 protein of unknown function [Taphrina deformans PYCC 5710]